MRQLETTGNNNQTDTGPAKFPFTKAIVIVGERN